MVGVDVKIARLSNLLKMNWSADNGGAFIVSATGTLVASPDLASSYPMLEGAALPNIEQSASPVMLAAHNALKATRKHGVSQDNVFTSFHSEGRAYFTTVLPFEKMPWAVVLYGSETHYLGALKNNQIFKVRLVSGVFSVLTFAWIGLDYLAFDRETWKVLASPRLFSTMVFFGLAWPWNLEKRLRTGFIMMAVMMANPPIFYVASHTLFAGQELTSLATMLATVYTMLPFIIIAGLSIFPLTALEAVLFALPILLLTALTPHLTGTGSLVGSLSTIWILALILGVYLMAGMSQLHSMISLVHRASKDPLTDLLTRRTGAEIIDLYFRISALHATPFSVMFLDLDNFKRINDEYGHEAGDEALRNAAKHLHEYLRRSDVIIRWGGEEIVAVLPNTNMDGVKLVLDRILKDWLGTRPDGKPLTASIGVAERISDTIDDWPELIEVADKRMYAAKKTGRARAIICHEEVMASNPPSNPT